MTTREMREFEQGRSYGYRHPAKVHGWTKSAAWNNGLRAGQAEYWKEWEEEQARAKVYWRYERRRKEAQGPPNY